jgi:hypothetical protein
MVTETDWIGTFMLAGTSMMSSAYTTDGLVVASCRGD